MVRARGSEFHRIEEPFAGPFVRYFPLALPCTVPGFATEPISDEERSVFRRWEVGSLVPILLLIPLLGYAWYLGLTRAASLFHHEAQGTRFLLQPSPVYWAIPPFEDGTSWSSREGLRDPVPKVDGQIAELVSQRSKRPITEQP